MQNSYIIDAFLMGLACFMLTYLYFNTKSRLRQLNAMMSANDMAAALGQLFTRSIVFATPFCLLLIFTLWRSYHLMLLTQTWGYGGLGLLLTMGLGGLFAVWLNAMLVCITHSGFVRAPMPPPAPSNPANQGSIYDRQ